MTEADEDVVVIDLKAAHRLLRFGHSLDYVAKRFDVETDGLRDALREGGHKIPPRIERQFQQDQRKAARRPAMTWEEAQTKRNARKRAQRERQGPEASRRIRPPAPTRGQLEQQRLDEFIQRHAKVRDTAAAYAAEVEFERRERTRLAEWLKQYADVLTGES